jgi:hypothetical protein
MWGFSSLAIVVYQKVASGFREEFVAQLHRQRWGYDTTKINQAQCEKVEDKNKKHALLQHTCSPRQNFLRHFHGLGALLHFPEVEELRHMAKHQGTAGYFFGVMPPFQTDMDPISKMIFWKCTCLGFPRFMV